MCVCVCAPLFQVGGRRVGGLLGDVRAGLPAARGGLHVPAPERLAHPHQGAVLPGGEAPRAAGLRGPPLPHRLGGLRVVQGGWVAGHRGGTMWLLLGRTGVPVSVSGLQQITGPTARGSCFCSVTLVAEDRRPCLSRTCEIFLCFPRSVCLSAVCSSVCLLSVRLSVCLSVHPIGPA